MRAAVARRRRPKRLYLQHHGGIYRSDNGGGSWSAMTGIAGMDFGFPVVAHPTRSGTAYLLPLESDEYRCTPNGRCTVWRTADCGDTWEALTAGLPQADAHLTVLRDAFTTDGQDAAGLYFRHAPAGSPPDRRRGLVATPRRPSAGAIGASRGCRLRSRL